MMSTLGSKNVDPCTLVLDLPTIRTPRRNSADPANEFPRTLRILVINTGNPFVKISRLKTPSKVINKIGFMKIDFIVWMTTRHFPLKILRLLFPSVDCGHLAGDATGLTSLFLFCRFVISIITYPIGLRMASEIGAIR